MILALRLKRVGRRGETWRYDRQGQSLLLLSLSLVVPRLRTPLLLDLLWLFSRPLNCYGRIRHLNSGMVRINLKGAPEETDKPEPVAPYARSTSFAFSAACSARALRFCQIKQYLSTVSEYWRRQPTSRLASKRSCFSRSKVFALLASFRANFRL